VVAVSFDLMICHYILLLAGPRGTPDEPEKYSREAREVLPMSGAGQQP
jgi:hypothetical protein